MRIIIAAFLSVAALLGQGTNSLVLNGTSQYVAVDPPNSAPFTSQDNLRVEFRMAAFPATPASTKRVMTLAGGDILVNLSTSGVLSVTDFQEASEGSPTSSISLIGLTDVKVRFQKQRNGREVLEVWNADCTGYLRHSGGGVADAARDYSGSISVGWNGGSGYLAAEFAWLRIYTTTVATLADEGACPDNITGGNLLGYEFESNLNDSSGNGQTFTPTGSPGYATTDFYAISGLRNNELLGMKSGSTVELDFSGNGGSTYSLANTSGTAFTLGDSTTSTPTINGTGFGQRTITLTVTDAAAQSDDVVITVGVVLADSDDIISSGDATIDAMIGKLLRYGVTDWTEYDARAVKQARYWYGDPGNERGDSYCQTAQAGTDGCDWVADDPEKTIYYGAAKGNYLLYYRTGLTQFKTQADALALFRWAMTNKWNSGSPTGGCNSNSFAAPRDSGVDDLVFYEVINSDTAMWSCITAYVDYHMHLWVEDVGGDNGFDGPGNGMREPGYTLYFAALMAITDPDGSGDRAAWLARLDTELTNYVEVMQCASMDTRIACTSYTTTATGTVSATGSGTAFVGSGSAAFTTEFTVGGEFWVTQTCGPNQCWYRHTVATITDDTHLSTVNIFPGTTAPGLTIYKTLSHAVTAGAFRWIDSNFFAGYAEQAFHTGVLMEFLTTYDQIKGGSSAARAVMVAWLDWVDANQINKSACNFDGAVNGNFAYYAWGVHNYGPPDNMTDCDDSGSLAARRSQSNTVIHAFGYACWKIDTAYCDTGDVLFGADFGFGNGPEADKYNGLLSDIQESGNDGKQWGQAVRSSQAYPAYRALAMAGGSPPATPYGPRLTGAPRITGAPRF